MLNVFPGKMIPQRGDFGGTASVTSTAGALSDPQNPLSHHPTRLFLTPAPPRPAKIASPRENRILFLSHPRPTTQLVHFWGLLTRPCTASVRRPRFFPPKRSVRASAGYISNSLYNAAVFTLFSIHTPRQSPDFNAAAQPARPRR